MKPITGNHGRSGDRVRKYVFTQRPSLYLLVPLLALTMSGCDGWPGVGEQETCEEDNVYACGCTCAICVPEDNCDPDDLLTYPLTKIVTDKTFQVCMPDNLNACKMGSSTESQLSQHCSDAFEQTYTHMKQQVIQIDPVEEPIACTCSKSTADTYHHDSCDGTCVPNGMPGNVHNFCPTTDLADCWTHTGTDTPICTAQMLDPPIPVPEGLAANFLPTTLCDVTGTATFDSSDIDPDENPASTGLHGRVAFTGQPCPGQSCSVGFAYHLNLDDLDIITDCAICENINLTNTTLAGGSLPEAVPMDSLGGGVIGQGELRLETVFTEDDETSAFVFFNANDDTVGVDWVGHTTCQANQSFTIPEVDLTDPAGTIAEIHVSTALVGNIVNEPPLADAGPDQIGEDAVECTSPDGALVTLDGSGSSDPQDNLTWYVWRRGLAFDDEVAGAGQSPTAQIQQALDATELYSLWVWDLFDQAARDTVDVAVADTTPPVIAAVALERNCLWPPNHKYFRFALGENVDPDVSDVCDEAPVVQVVDVVSSQPDDSHGDGATTADVLFGPGGFCLRSERGAAGGAGRTYTVTIAATDASDNTSTFNFVVTVPHAHKNGGCPNIPETQFVNDAEVGTACVFPNPLVVD